MSNNPTAPAAEETEQTMNGSTAADPQIEDAQDDRALMEQYLQDPTNDYYNLQYGDTVDGIVMHIDRDEILVDIGSKSEGIVPSKEMSSLLPEERDEIKVGEVFLGKVVRIMPFGAFVNLVPGKDGMVHISELDEQRVEQVEDVVKLGDEINVMVIGVEPGTGKVSLSRRAILTGESAEDRRAAGGGRSTRGGDSGGRGGFREGDRGRPRRREER